MGAKGHRYKLSTHNIACPACLQNPNVREGGAVVATCSTCRGLGQLPAIPATNPRLGPRVHQMQMVHALAHYLAARRSFAAYAEEVAASGRPDDGATHITFTVTVLAEPFFRTWMEVALKKGWTAAEADGDRRAGDDQESAYLAPVGQPSKEAGKI